MFTAYEMWSALTYVKFLAYQSIENALHATTTWNKSKSEINQNANYKNQNNAFWDVNKNIWSALMFQVTYKSAFRFGNDTEKQLFI